MIVASILKGYFEAEQEKMRDSAVRLAARQAGRRPGRLLVDPFKGSSCVFSIIIYDEFLIFEFFARKITTYACNEEPKPAELS